jgi:hypothetical protein
MAPTEGQINVAIEALRTDAAMWDAGGDDLREAARVAGRLDLEALHFSYLGDKIGLVDVYQQLQDKMIRLLNQGGDTFEALGTALRSAADGYEQDEANGVHRANSIY